MEYDLEAEKRAALEKAIAWLGKNLADTARVQGLYLEVSEAEEKIAEILKACPSLGPK